MPKQIISGVDDQQRYRENVEEIARNIAMLSRQVAALLSGRLKRDAIIILLAQSSGYPKSTINDVLKAIEGMEVKFLNK